MAVGARAPVGGQTMQLTIDERVGAAVNRVARLVAAVECGLHREPGHSVLERRWLTGAHRERGRQNEAAGKQQQVSFHGFSFLQIDGVDGASVFVLLRGTAA